MKKRTVRIVDTDNVFDFERNCNNLLEDGWSMFGSPSINVTSVGTATDELFRAYNQTQMFIIDETVKEKQDRLEREAIRSVIVLSLAEVQG